MKETPRPKQLASAAMVDGCRLPTNRWWLAIVVAAAGALAYLNSFSGVFILDDFHAIRDNPHIRQLWPITRAMSAPPQSSVAGRPVVSLSLALNYAVGGLDPRGYHAFNLAVHILAGLLLFSIVRRALRSAALRETYGSAAEGLALIVAVLWVVHPLQTESVTYVIQRAESLMGLFYLLTIYGALRGFATSQRRWYVASILACALGMATKEVMVTAPVMVLLCDRSLAAGSFRRAWQQRWPLYAGLAATWAVLAVLVVGGPRSTSAGFGLETITPMEYARSQPGVILHYIRLCFWPRPLCLDYGWPVARTAWQILAPSAAVAGLLILTVWTLWRRPAIGLPGAWFFLILAPTSGFIPIMDLAFEHRMYLPLAAVVVSTVAAGYRLLGVVCRRIGLSPRRRWLLAGSVVLIAVGPMIWATNQRNQVYSDGAELLRQAVAVNPRNARAHNNLANKLSAKQQLVEAIEHYRLALRFDPNYIDARLNLALALNDLGNQVADRNDHRRAVEHYQEALRFNPLLTKAHNNLGTALRALGDVDQAVRHYREALRIKPRYVSAMINLGNALRQQSRLDEAVEQYQAAVQTDANNANAHLMLGTAYYDQDRVDEAIGEYRRALELDSSSAHAYHCLGLALARQGKIAEALQSYRTALTIKPDHAQARQALDSLDKSNQ